MLVRKTDIGADIIHILTKGMYLDPKDTIREYIQNGVDAKATNISIKIRQDLIVIQDDGSGMDKETMRKSIRIGISEKNPSQNVGFMGIGIYSAYHLCEELHIYSNKKNGTPHILRFNFKGMRDKLELQREQRFESKLLEKDVIALQDLLDEHIELNELSKDEFPRTGTRVELIGIPNSFFKTISEFSETAEYLEKVIPLTFNPEFKHSIEIQNYITNICKNNNLEFSLINCSLQINDEQRMLYRPYLDEYFDPFALAPEFHLLKDGREIYGIAWGCLNGSTNSIEKKHKIRGFILKKHGFTIGESKDLLPYFGRQLYFNRYVGEVIVLHPKLLPNASRIEFEYSSNRVIFQDLFRDVAQRFNKTADDFQEETKAKEVLDIAITYLKINKAQLNHIIDNSDNLLKSLWECKEQFKKLDSRKIDRYGDASETAKAVKKQLEDFAKEITGHIDTKKKAKANPKAKKTESEIVDDIKNIPTTTQNDSSTKSFDSLIHVIDTLGLELSDEMINVLKFIDEEFIRIDSDDIDDYKETLLKLRDNLDELLNDL